MALEKYKTVMSKDEVFDYFFGTGVVINKKIHMEKISTPDLPLLRRFAILLKKILFPEEIAFLDKRLRKIGGKRDFDFTGSFGDMLFVIDINAVQRKKGDIERFTINTFAVDPKMIYESMPVIDTETLNFSSLILGGDEPEGSLLDSINEIKDWVEEEATPSAVYEALKEILNMFAAEPEIGYQSFLTPFVHDEKGERVAMIPGIVPRD